MRLTLILLFACLMISSAVAWNTYYYDDYYEVPVRVRTYRTYNTYGDSYGYGGYRSGGYGGYYNPYHQQVMRGYYNADYYDHNVFDYRHSYYVSPYSGVYKTYRSYNFPAARDYATGSSSGSGYRTTYGSGGRTYRTPYTTVSY